MTITEQIKNFKGNIGDRAERVIADGMGLEKRANKYRCPNKLSHNNGDKTPSMSWFKEGLFFRCFSCGEIIDIYNYYTNYKNMNHDEVMALNGNYSEDHKITIQNRPEFKLEPLKDFQMEYLKKRGLSENTVTFFKLGDISNNIGIPYLSNGNVTGIKYKTMNGDKTKYKSISGSQLGLLNRDNLDTNKSVVITEGEFDALAVYESGYCNVVSVGSGANSLDKLFKTDGDLLRKFKSIVLLADNDKAGKDMMKKFQDEFGYLVKFPDYDLYNGLKDMNEILLQYSKEHVLKIIKSATNKVEGKVNAADEDIEFDISKVERKYIPTGIPSIDYAINDLVTAELSLVTGRSNSGKSTYISQIIASALDKGFKVFLVSGEGTIPTLMNNLYQNIIGGNDRYYDIKTVNKRSFKVAKPFVLNALKKWHGDRFTIFSKGESKLKTTGELLSMMAEEIKINKPDLVIIDNMMSVLSIEKASEKWERQADFIENLSSLAKTENVHCQVVLHPNKEVRKNSKMEMENISGSSDMSNKADVILSVRRMYDEDKDKDHDGEITVIKNRNFSEIPTVSTTFDHETKMLLEIDADGVPFKYKLSWEKYINVDDLIENPLPTCHMNHDDACDPKKYIKPKKKEERLIRSKLS